MWFLIANIIANCFYSFFTILTVEVFKKATSLVQNNDSEGVRNLIFMYVGIIVVYVIFSRFTRNVWASMRHDGRWLIQQKIFPVFFKLDNTSVERLGTGKIQSIMDRALMNWKELFVKLSQKIPDLSILTLFVVYQIFEIWGRAYIGIFFGLFVMIFVVVCFLNAKSLSWRQQKEIVFAEHSRQFVKMIMSKMEIVQNNKEKSELQKDFKVLQDVKNYDLKVNTIWWFLYRVGNLFSLLLNIFILYYGWTIITSGGELSLFVGLLASATLFQKVLDNSIILYKEFSNEFTAVQKLRDTFDEIPPMKNKYSDTLFHYKKGEICIKNLGFSYNKENPVFDDFSLTIEGGKKTAFVGLSWSGKSTLIKLIAWYLSADQGEILVDGQNIQEINMYDYFSHIGYLTQEPSVFDGTIYENLVYALKEKPEESELSKVITLAKCEFIYDFPDGLQTEIGEKGIRLSGGQRQRLAIAKIMLKNPDIILLDEPTSALDSFNEEEISQALNHLFRGKTVIIIAHRLQTVKNADQILLFEFGKVVESGTHEELIKLNGKYKKMLDLQSGF